MSMRRAASCCHPLQEMAVPRGARMTLVSGLGIIVGNGFGLQSSHRGPGEYLCRDLQPEPRMRARRPVVLVRTLLATLATFATLASAARAQGRVEADLDAYIAKGMQEWHIPGLSIAIVKDDRVVYAKGFGVRRLGAPDRVDARMLAVYGQMARPGWAHRSAWMRGRSSG